MVDEITVMRDLTPCHITVCGETSHSLITLLLHYLRMETAGLSSIILSCVPTNIESDVYQKTAAVVKVMH